jgi:RHS repeat-associated protein
MAVDPAQLANIARQATANAGAIEHANQQLAAGGSPAEASAFDVWTHTGNALGQQAGQLAKDGPSAQGAVDSLPAMKAALTSPMASTTAGSAYDGAVANMESVIGDAATLFGLNPDKPAPEGALAKVGAAFGALTGIEQSLSAVLSAIPTPAFPAARITDLAFGLPHVHAHPPNIVPPAPPIALPSVGPVIPIPLVSGADRTLINNLPAARCGDMGIGVWCGGYFPLYEIFLGSSSVWIEGSRAARMPVDITKHCIFTPKPKAPPTGQDPPMGPNVGFLTTASPNVIIGGIPMPSLLSFAMGAALKGLGGVAKAVARRPAAAFSRFAQRVGRRLGKNMKPGFIKCTLLRAEPVHVVTGEVVVDQQDFELPGRIPIRWTRHYRSSSERVGACGHGWETPADARLELGPDGDITFMDGAGVAACFPTLPEQEPVLELVDGATLQQVENHCVVRLKSGLSYYFPIPHGPVAEVLVTAVVDACRNSLHFVRDQHGLKEVVESAGRRLEVKSRDGLIREIWLHHPDFPQRRLLVRYEYDLAGDLVCVYDPLDAPSRFAYRNHRMVRHTNRNGLSFYYEYDRHAPDGRVLHTWGDGGLYDYHFVYNPAERWTEFTNSLGHTSRIEYDPRLLITRETDPLGGVTTYAYDQVGRTTAVVDPMGHTTGYKYDERGNLLVVVEPDGATLINDYDDQDNPTRSIDPRGGEWLRRYDERHRCVEQRDPLGHTTLYRYGDLDIYELIDAQQTSTSFEHDHYGNLTGLTTPDGAVQRWTFDILGDVATTRDARGNVERIDHDAAGRRVLVEQIDGNAVRLDYDAQGRVTRLRDQLKDVRFKYFGLDRLATRTEAGTMLRFTYDSEEQLVAITNERGETYRYEVDPRGEVAAEVGFDGARRVFRRDAAGRIVQIERASGLTTRYELDPCGRIVIAQHSDGTSQRFAYDPEGDVIEAWNGEHHVVLERDALGQIVRETQDGQTVESAYDEVGHRVAMRTSRRLGLQIARDFAGNVVELAIGSTDFAARRITFKRDILGLEIERGMPGAVTARWQRDPLGRVYRQSAGPDTTDMFARVYDWEVDDRLVATRDSTVGVTRFAYESSGGLVAAQTDGSTPQVRAFDEIGAVYKRFDRSDRRYGPADQVLQADGMTFNYDADGNLTSKRLHDGRAWTYEWDAAGMLVAATSPEGSITRFAYDAFGRRLLKRTATIETRWLWDGNCVLHEWADDDTISPRTWLIEPDGSAPIALLRGDDFFGVVADQVGVPRVILDDAGQPVWSAHLDIFGKLETTFGAPDFCPLRWPGQYADQETGLYYNRARYYDPDTGLYISQDPIRLAGGLLLYSYVRDPNAWIDPFGLATKRCGNVGSQRWSKKVTKDGRPYKKPGPKTDPNGPHNKKIQAIIDEETAKGKVHIGGGSKTEITISTPGGHKPYRRADASFRDPVTGEISHHNVGRATKDGSPIARERRARDDIRDKALPENRNVTFHEYKP